MKINTKKNNLFGKYSYLFFKKRFFSETSKLMKYKRFYNLNLISNHNFYNNFFFFLKNLEKNLIIFYFLKNNLFKYNIIPNFLFNKKIFLDYLNFIKFSKKNNLHFLNISNNELNSFKFDLYGNNFLIFSNKNIENKDLMNLKNDYNLDLYFKNQINLDNLFYINYFFNFNLFISNILEFYKILSLLNFNNLNKN
jgi:hypothetical protein